MIEDELKILLKNELDKIKELFLIILQFDLSILHFIYRVPCEQNIRQSSLRTLRE